MNTFRSRSPQNPSDVVVEVPAATADDVAKAAERARTAQREWARIPAAGRSAALTAAAEAFAADADNLTALMVREVGKPLGEARGEVGRAVAILRYYAQQVFDPVGEVLPPSMPGTGLLYTARRPHGVAGLVTPWNFPVAIPLWKAAPALAFGNAVLLKPAPEATACALRLGELLGASLPTDLFTVLPGDAEPGQAVIGAADVVSFTGSVAVGGLVTAAAVGRGIPVQAELGGQNASIVLPDADLIAAAAAIAGAAMGYAGQKCTATKRVIAVGDPAPLRDALVEAVAALTVGDPADEGVVAGPVIDEAAGDRVVDAAASAIAAGGRVLTGGTRADGSGWFVAPTVVEGVPADHLLAREEVFGPISVLQSVGSIDEAVALANSVRHGLVSAVFTSDLDTALSAAQQLDTGMVKINAPTSGVDFYAPFGGEKASSYGQREQGKAARDFYTSSRTVTIAPARG
ncbi:MAG TPA: aldehyde dehydrogenase family protein [Jiangellaceae bacterium]|nr:aldehyde dehydrogenase family protein [Jiangellaceae bacterium]